MHLPRLGETNRLLYTVVVVVAVVNVVVVLIVLVVVVVVVVVVVFEQLGNSNQHLRIAIAISQEGTAMALL